MISTYEPFGENSVKAALLGSGRTYHYDEINNQIHKIIKQSCKVSQLKIEDYFIRKLQGMAVTPSESAPILNTHLKGYVPYGRQLGTLCN